MHYLQSVSLAHLSNILTELENSESIEMHEKGDEEFFVNAMDLAFEARNIDIAERIIALYRSPKNHIRLPAFLGEAEFVFKLFFFFFEK